VSLTDTLTRLPNRRHLDDLLRSLQPGDAVAMLDLDHLGAVNETLGSNGGDDVLTAFGRFLRSKLRDGDFAGRYGGDEFILVLRGRQGDAASTAVDRLLRSWRRTTLAATFSAGTVVCRQGEPSDSAVERAERVLRQAKRAGRDQQVSETDEVDLSAIIAELPPLRRSAMASAPLRV
jgi:diguanylate cyclase (GGDEF)-like protein